MHEIIIVTAKYLIALPVVAVVVLAFRLTNQQRMELLGVLALGGAFSLALSRLGSHFYYDPRPFVVGHFTPLIPHGNDNGFPSDHTLLSAFLAFAVLHFSKKLGWSLLAVAAIIGLARVAAQVHHLVDIAGSFIITSVSCFVALLVVQAISKRVATARKKPTPRAA